MSFVKHCITQGFGAVNVQLLSSRTSIQPSLYSFSFYFPLGVLCFSELSFITEPSDVTVLPKSSAILDCQAHGQPPVTIKWLKNGHHLDKSEHMQFLPNGSLYIPKIKHTKEDSDEGFYQCLSQNKYGAILSQRSRLTISSEYGAQSKGHYPVILLCFSLLEPIWGWVKRVDSNHLVVSACRHPNSKFMGY